jgi:hypothetical protein
MPKQNKENNNSLFKTPQKIPLYNEKPYGTISQNNALNNIFRVNDKHNTKELPFNKKRVQADAVTVITKATHLGLAEAQMLDYINYKFNQLSDHEHTKQFSFTLKEYMKDTGRKDPKTTRNAIKQRLDTIASTTYSYSGGDENNPYNQSFGAHPLLGYDYRRGKVYIDLTNFFHDLLVYHSMPMAYFKLMFKLDPKKDSTALYILRAILENKRINKASPRSNRIRVKTLLEKIPSLPSYDEVMGSNRHVYDRIIAPVLEGVERLAQPDEGAFTRYSFMGKDAKPLDYDSIDYDSFVNADLIIEEWNQYPEEDLEKWDKKQKEIIKKNQKKKEKRTKKNKDN